MQLCYGVPTDIGPWMALVTEVRWNFPGLETAEALDEHRATVLRFMEKRQAICVKDGTTLAGVLLFSRGHNRICCLVVAPAYRRRGVASMLLEEALAQLDRTKEISVSTFRADDPKGTAPRALYEKFGFVPDALVEEFGYPNQVFVHHPTGAERKGRQLAINAMVQKICQILADNEPTIYLYGSCALDDFRLGWSDIDMLVLTRRPLTEAQAAHLVGLRQTMLSQEQRNSYYRSMEGGILPLDALVRGDPDRGTPTPVVYWGTSGERITDRYVLDSFGRMQLLDSGILLHGEDVRQALARPTFHELYTDVRRHYETIRQYCTHTGRSLYSFGWLLDTARCIYTLRTGAIIAKTAAAEWALENDLCPDPAVLSYALTVRRAPQRYKDDQAVMDYAETLAGPIQRFADVLEQELTEAQRKLPTELR